MDFVKHFLEKIKGNIFKPTSFVNYCPGDFAAFSVSNFSLSPFSDQSSITLQDLNITCSEGEALNISIRAVGRSSEGLLLPGPWNNIATTCTLPGSSFLTSHFTANNIIVNHYYGHARPAKKGGSGRLANRVWFAPETTSVPFRINKGGARTKIENESARQNSSQNRFAQQNIIQNLLALSKSLSSSQTGEDSTIPKTDIASSAPLYAENVSSLLNIISNANNSRHVPSESTETGKRNHDSAVESIGLASGVRQVDKSASGPSPFSLLSSVLGLDRMVQNVGPTMNLSAYDPTPSTPTQSLNPKLPSLQVAQSSLFFNKTRFTNKAVHKFNASNIFNMAFNQLNVFHINGSSTVNLSIGETGKSYANSKKPATEQPKIDSASPSVTPNVLYLVNYGTVNIVNKNAGDTINRRDGISNGGYFPYGESSGIRAQNRLANNEELAYQAGSYQFPVDSSNKISHNLEHFRMTGNLAKGRRRQGKSLQLAKARMSSFGEPDSHFPNQRQLARKMLLMDQLFKHIDAESASASNTSEIEMGKQKTDTESPVNNTQLQWDSAKNTTKLLLEKQIAESTTDSSEVELEEQRAESAGDSSEVELEEQKSESASDSSEVELEEQKSESASDRIEVELEEQRAESAGDSSEVELEEQRAESAGDSSEVELEEQKSESAGDSSEVELEEQRAESAGDSSEVETDTESVSSTSEIVFGERTDLDDFSQLPPLQTQGELKYSDSYSKAYRHGEDVYVRDSVDDN